MQIPLFDFMNDFGW